MTQFFMKINEQLLRFYSKRYPVYMKIFLHHLAFCTKHFFYLINNYFIKLSLFERFLHT